MDINHKNIILKRQDLLPHLIDFGLSIKIEDYFNTIFYVNKEDVNIYPDTLNTNYPIWPIELRFISKMFCQKLTPANLLSKIKYIYEQISGEPRQLYSILTYSIMNNTLPETLVQYNGLLLTKNPEQFWLDIINKSITPSINNPQINAWRNSLPNKKDDLLNYKLKSGTPEFELHSKILKGIDIYSIGFLLSQMYIRYVGQMNIHIPKNGKNYQLIDINFNEMKINDLNIQFLDKLYYQLTIPFYEFVNKLVNFDFNLRLDIESAINEFKLLIPLFDILKTSDFDELYIARL